MVFSELQVFVGILPARGNEGNEILYSPYSWDPKMVFLM